MNNLYSKLEYIGFRVQVESSSGEFIDIEKTLYDASIECSNDGRMFSLLCSWVSVHGHTVIIDKLITIEKKFGESCWLSALAVFAKNKKIHKWGRLIKKQKKPIVFGDIEIAKSLIKIKGNHEYFNSEEYLIPKGSLRLREDDVLSVSELIKKNTQYKNRFLFGVNLRSDIIDLYQSGVGIPYQISKLLNCNFESPQRILKEVSLLYQD